MITINYYFDCKIQKNHLIYAISDYLKSFTKDTYVEWLQLESTLNNIKDFVSDEESFSFLIKCNVLNNSAFKSLNYIKLSDGVRTRYYFVTDKKQVSENVVRLFVELDVANTYANDITIPSMFKQVQMKRRHKNRWYKQNEQYFRIYDKVDESLGDLPKENINAYSLGKDLDTNLYAVTRGYDDLDTDTSHDKAYLLGPLPLRNELYASKETQIEVDKLAIVDTATSNGNYYGGHLYYTKDGGIMAGRLTVSGVGTRYFMSSAILIMASSGNYYPVVYVGYMNGSTFYPTLEFKFTSGHVINFSIESNRTVQECYSNNTGRTSLLEIGKGYTVGSTTKGDEEFLFLNGYTPSTHSTTYEVSTVIPSVYSLNKVDSNIKNIEMLPLSVIGNFVRYVQGNILFTNNNISGEFAKDFTELGEINYLKDIKTTSVITRNMNYESKMFGSYVMDRQLIYDAFALPLQFEYLSANRRTTLRMYVDKPIDMTGSFCFGVPYNFNSTTYLSTYMTCQRNNNITIYTSDYIDYIRNGYNYDQKQQSMNKLKTGIDLSIGAVSANLGLAKGVASGGSVGMLAGTTALGQVSSAINSAFALEQNTRALNQKRMTLMTASPTMSGSTSVEMFADINGGNYVKYVRSEPSSSMKNKIYNMFYFNGYADNEYYDTLPSMQTRYFFDFVQASIGRCTIGDTKERERVVRAYEEGITFEWKFNNTWLSVSNTLYENFERNIEIM